MAVCNIRLGFGITGRPEVMSLVYRIQLKQNKRCGAYHCMPYVSIAAKSKHPQPTPPEDIGIERYPEDNEYCGFASAIDLLKWFGRSIPALLKKGCEIVALNDVTITAVGEYQVLFTFNT